METDFFGRTLNSHLPTPATDPALFEGVLTRRVFAFMIDWLIMGAIMILLFIVAIMAGVITFGLAWFAIPFISPIAMILYYLATLGSANRATIGMRFCDLVMTPTRETSLSSGVALLHAVLYYVSVSILTPFILVVGLFTSRRQMLHDLVMGVLIVRRAPMEQHWR